MDEVTIGERLRVLRKWRGKTQKEVADLAGISQAFMSQVENGKRALDRRSDIAGLATALRVSETDIIGGPHLSADPVQSEPHLTIPALREALQTNTLTAPAVDQARPLPELTAEMTHIDRSEYKLAHVGELLPSLIDELHVHACAPADEAAYRLALQTLIEAFQTATFTAKDLGYVDLACVAAMRAAELADILDDPVSRGKAATLRIHTMPATSRGQALRMAERAADAIEPHVQDDTSVCVLGMITLAAALAATVTYRYDAADHWLDEATELGTRTPDTPADNWGAFSATNIGVWRVALAAERGKGGRAMLDLAAKVDEQRLSGRRGRHAAFLADVGRGLAREPRTWDQAIRWLRRAEDVAPHKIRNNSSVRHTVEVLLGQAASAAVSLELRGMAARMGIPH